MTDEELADTVLERLQEFSPAVAIKDGTEEDQVELWITMNRTPLKTVKAAVTYTTPPQPEIFYDPLPD